MNEPDDVLIIEASAGASRIAYSIEAIPAEYCVPANPEIEYVAPNIWKLMENGEAVYKAKLHHLACFMEGLKIPRHVKDEPYCSSLLRLNSKLRRRYLQLLTAARAGCFGNPQHAHEDEYLDPQDILKAAQWARENKIEFFQPFAEYCARLMSAPSDSSGTLTARVHRALASYLLENPNIDTTSFDWKDKVAGAVMSKNLCGLKNEDKDSIKRLARAPLETFKASQVG